MTRKLTEAGREPVVRGMADKPRQLAAGAVVAVAVMLLAVPGVGAQDQSSVDSHDATVANDVNATAISNAEISTGDIVTGHNDGNSVSTADTHEGNITIDGGNFLSPTQIDFYIDSGYNDAYADGGLNDAASSGPSQDLNVDRDVDVDVDN